MKKRKSITINFSNRWLYFLITLGILVIISVGVYALTPGTKPNPGHLVSEMAPPSPCTANQFLQFDGTNWKCTNVTAGSSLIKGTAVYQLNSNCGTGLTTSSASCSYTTTTCGTSSIMGVPCYKYYTCSGSCSYSCGSAQTCTYPNTLVGYLVN